MHRPTQRGRCWSQKLCQKNQVNSTEIAPDGTMGWAQSWLYLYVVLVYDLLFGASFRRLRSEKLSASGGALPLAPHQRLCPWTPLGALSPDPLYRLALRARHGLAPSWADFIRGWGAMPPISEDNLNAVMRRSSPIRVLSVHTLVSTPLLVEG